METPLEDGGIPFVSSWKPLVCEILRCEQRHSASPQFLARAVPGSLGHSHGDPKKALKMMEVHIRPPKWYLIETTNFSLDLEDDIGR